jgi:hypothetical protein
MNPHMMRCGQEATNARHEVSEYVYIRKPNNTAGGLLWPQLEGTG